MHLVETLDPINSSFPNHREVLDELKRCREARNEMAHRDYSSPEAGAKSDDELFEHISAARKYLPKINTLNEEGTAAIQIRRKLGDLQHCLWLEEEDVKIQKLSFSDSE